MMTPIEEMTIEDKVSKAILLKDTPSFFIQYFEHLPYFDTHKACFEYFNTIHLSVFGSEKYSSYDSFKKCLYRDGKKYLKNK